VTARPAARQAGPQRLVALGWTTCAEQHRACARVLERLQRYEARNETSHSRLSHLSARAYFRIWGGLKERFKRRS
jgi:hypothetical protein